MTPKFSSSLRNPRKSCRKEGKKRNVVRKWKKKMGWSIFFFFFLVSGRPCKLFQILLSVISTEHGESMASDMDWVAWLLTPLLPFPVDPVARPTTLETFWGRKRDEKSFFKDFRRLPSSRPKTL